MHELGHKYKTENHMAELEVFEIMRHRTMWQITWTNKITNTEVLERLLKEYEIINTITYLGHVMADHEYKLHQKKEYWKAP